MKKVLDSCVVCKRQKAPPCEQFMSDLPPARTQIHEPPFFHTGVDYFGPILVKQGRSRVKRYGCIFTCMSVKAIHLEIAFSLTTDSFVQALTRFIKRRGLVAHIYSDNGTNFVGAEKFLRESIREWNQTQICDFFRQKEIDWHFNTPTASHFGGAWERLIRTVKNVMQSLSPHHALTDENLATLFVEVEAMVNSRPLTPFTFVEGNDKPLSPNDMLIFKPSHTLVSSASPSDAYSTNRWR